MKADWKAEGEERSRIEGKNELIQNIIILITYYIEYNNWILAVKAYSWIIRSIVGEKEITKKENIDSRETKYQII